MIKVQYEFISDKLNLMALEGGSKIADASTGYKTCSIGVPARKGTQSGIVTAGHCFRTGEQTNIGKVTARAFSKNSQTDLEFIETNKAAPLKDISMSYGTVNKLLYQGESVVIHTWKGSRFGKVTGLNISLDYYFDNYEPGIVTGLIETNIVTENGMSGAPLIANSMYPYAAAGILSSGNSSSSYFVTTYAINSKLGVTVGN